MDFLVFGFWLLAMVAGKVAAAILPFPAFDDPARMDWTRGMRLGRW